PLQPGHYTLTLGTGLTDRAGNPLVQPYVRHFVTAGLAPFILENRSNDTLATATSLSPNPGSTQPLAEDPAGSGLRSGYGRGNLSSTSDADYWSFTANAGDTLKVAADIPGAPVSSQLHYYVYDPAGNRLTDFYNGTSSGQGGESAPLVLSATGTYRVLVSSWYDYEGEYRIRATLAAPGTQVESE